MARRRTGRVVITSEIFKRAAYLVHVEDLEI